MIGTDTYFILCGTAGATLWIITLTSYTALLKSLRLTIHRADLRDIAQEYNFVIVAWYASTLAIIASCFQIPLFASLLMLIGAINPIVVRALALITAVLGLLSASAGDFVRLSRRLKIADRLINFSDRRLFDLRALLNRTFKGPGTYYTWIGRFAIVLGPLSLVFAPFDYIKPVIAIGSPILLWLGINLAIIQSMVAAILYSIAEENAIDGGA